MFKYMVFLQANTVICKKSRVCKTVLTNKFYAKVMFGDTRLKV